MFTMLCLGCTGFVYHQGGHGWVHTDGHGAIWQRCACGWSGSEASRLASARTARAFCPWCGSIAVTDDHVAMPDRAAQAGNATIYLLVILLVALPLAFFALRTAAEIGHALGGTP